MFRWTYYEETTEIKKYKKLFLFHIIKQPFGEHSASPQPLPLDELIVSMII